jgi:hypothetical protein
MLKFISMDSFDPTECLPANKILKSGDNHLYRIGLCHSSNSNANRSKFHNPILISMINLILLIKNITSLVLPEEDERLLIIFGDFAHFLGIRIHLNIACGLYTLLSLTSQLMYYYNYKNGINPKFLKLFEMMSGLVSPKTIGLTNREVIYNLIKFSKSLFLLCAFNNEIIVPIFTFLLCFVPFIMNCSVMDSIIFGIPHSFHTSLSAYYMYNINTWQVLYFYLICRYIKIRIRELNEEIDVKIEKGLMFSNGFLTRIMRSLNHIYSEINEYNDTFWSKYIITVWFIYGSVISIALYFISFVEMEIVCEITLIYAVVISIMIFLFIINTASSVNYEANKSIKLLNHIMVSNSKPLIGINSVKGLLEILSIRVKVNENF